MSNVYPLPVRLQPAPEPNRDVIISPATTRVLLALLRVQVRDGRATVQSVQREAGLRSTNNTHRHLRCLVDLGLVTWPEHTNGALHAPLAVVLPHRQETRP